MKKTVQIVTIPLGDKGIYKADDLIKKPAFEEAGAVERYRIATHNFDGGIWQPQQLLVLSDEEIKEGDWVICINNGVNHYKVIQNKIPSAFQDVEGWKKIIASTDPSLGLPAIPQSFIEKYVIANGEIDEVELDTEERIHEGSTMKHVIFKEKLKLTKDNEVCVISNEVSVSNHYSLMQLKEAINLAYVIGATGDTTYPECEKEVLQHIRP